MRLPTPLAFFLFAGLLCVLPACKKEISPSSPAFLPAVSDYNSDVARDWNAKFLEIERDAEGYRPLPATRALAYLGLSAYEACLPGMPNFKSQLAQCPGLLLPTASTPGQLHWPTVINASYAYLMLHFFPFAEDKITALENGNNGVYTAQINAAAFALSQQYGRDVAAAVWAWSKTDLVGHDAYLDPFKSHQPASNNLETGPKPWFPDWGQVRTFAISTADKICPAPSAYGNDINARVYAEGLEVYARTTNATNEDNLGMTEFWSDDFLHLTFSTGSRWISIANQIYAKDAVNLETALYCNTKLGFALNDAAVACWASKFHYKVANPVDFIQQNIDPAWMPLLKNPLTGETEFAAGFPAYPSEHAVLAGAAAEVLGNIFGLNYTLTDNSHAGATLFDGTPRTFSSFYEMAEENAVSRILTGLNMRMDSEQGIGQGYKCGRKVNDLSWQ